MVAIWNYAVIAATVLQVSAVSVALNVSDRGSLAPSINFPRKPSLTLLSPTDSIRRAASVVAYNLQTYYKNNASDTPSELVGTLPFPPYYWWQSGAMWGGLVDYWAYTKDSTYVNNTMNAYIAQSGAKRDLMTTKWADQTGNDDQAFWALGMMSAVELGFPSPPTSQPQYLEVAKNAFDTQVARWDTAGCDGGLRWQILTTHPGYPYMNTISNGAFFQLAARLARYTGNGTYVEWADKAYDWILSKGLVNQYCDAFDGTDSNSGCVDLNRDRWSYNVAMLLYGAATMYNHTLDSKWMDRTNCLLGNAGTFLYPNANASNVLYEPICEPSATCNNDQFTFKGYLGRWMAKTVLMVPSTRQTVFDRLQASASAAALSCTGGANNETCGTKWYVGGYDGMTGAGQHMSALEVIQGLLVEEGGAPRRADA